MQLQSLSTVSTPDSETKEDAQKSCCHVHVAWVFLGRGSFSGVGACGGNVAYAAGTMGAMTITTTLIGRADEVFNRPAIPQKLSSFSSLLAIAIGLVWYGLALKPTS